jgi:glycosyltransferase involved in cell wall biosynthesis
MKAAILLPTLAGHDAVGNDALTMAALLRSRGITTRVFCETTIGVAERTSPLSELKGFCGPHDLLIYHFSVGWPAGLEALRGSPAFRVVRYHNITPPEFFAGISTAHEQACRRGRAEVPRLARLGCELYLCASAYNMGELRAEGAPAERCAVLPPFHRIAHLMDAEADLGLLDRLCDGAHNILMVGRIAPNKGHVELVDAFAAFVDGWGDPARLLIVGKRDLALAAYAERIQERIERHRLGTRVRWLESVSESQLKAAYLASSAFMTLSGHEGFCVPLVEAMALGVPVVARDRSAIAETVGDGGIVWDEVDPCLYAATLARLRDDADLRGHLRERAHRRYAREFAPEVLRQRFFDLLDRAA